MDNLQTNDSRKELKLVAQFMKDCSFESPNAPAFFFKKESVKANASVNLEIQIKSSENNLYMVDLITKVHHQVENDKNTIFLIELVYSGLVSVQGLEGAELQHKLMVDIPNLLYPNVRALILRLTGESGYPPFVMGGVDFEQLYIQNQAKQKEMPKA